jgi:hypothetical protein
MGKPADERIERGAAMPACGCRGSCSARAQTKHKLAFHERFEHQPLYRVLDYQTLADSDRGLEQRAEEVTVWHAGAWLRAPRPTSVSAW